MIIIKNYSLPGFFLRNNFGKIILKILNKKISNNIRIESKRGSSDQILAPLDVIKFLGNNFNAIPHEHLYNEYIKSADELSLSKAINDFINIANHYDNSLNFGIVRTYIYSLLMSGPIQVIEYAKNCELNKKSILYFGKKNDLEYKIFSNFGKINIRISVPILLLICLEKIYVRTKKLFFSKIKNKKKLIYKKNLIKSNKKIIINILEERRFERISVLKKELEKHGYDVYFYSAQAKKETFSALRKNQGFDEKVIFERDHISIQEVGVISNSIKIQLNQLRKTFKNGCLKSIKYHDIPIFEYIVDDLIEMLMFRMTEACINEVAIDSILNDAKVLAYIGMDNSVANAVWMDRCKKYGIASFFYFYNATALPYVFKMQVDSYSPTAWILGSYKLSENFKKSYSSIHQIGNPKLLVSGDLYLDVIKELDKKREGGLLRKRWSIPEGIPVVTLISSYITSEFTRDDKKSLFINVASAVDKLNIKLVIKPHPNEDIRQLKEEISEWGIVAYVLEGESLLKVLCITDLLIMYFSEAAQQAMQFGIPVISITNKKFINIFDGLWNYYSSGAVKVIGLNESAYDVVRELLYCESMRESLIEKGAAYVRHNFGNGGAAEKSAKIIDDYIKNEE